MDNHLDIDADHQLIPGYIQTECADCIVRSAGLTARPMQPAGPQKEH